MQTLNYALAQNVELERARELGIRAHSSGIEVPSNLCSLRTVLLRCDGGM